MFTRNPDLSATSRTMGKCWGWAMLCAILVVFVVPRSLLASDAWMAVVDFVAGIAPSVDVLSWGSVDPLRARSVWALEWMAFPVFLFALLRVDPLWGTRGRPIRVVMPPGWSVFKSVFVVHMGLVVGACLISSDLRLSDFFGGFLRGGLFRNDAFDPSKPWSWFTPYGSRFGMVVISAYVSVVNSCVYFMFLKFALNYDLVVRLMVRGRG